MDSKFVSALRKGDLVLLQGHPCEITAMCVTKMMAWSSGRGPEPVIWCDGCRTRLLPTGVRYACLDCDDFDWCETCEVDPDRRRAHAHGLHLFAKIRPGSHAQVDTYRQHAKQ